MKTATKEILTPRGVNTRTLRLKFPLTKMASAKLQVNASAPAASKDPVHEHISRIFASGQNFFERLGLEKKTVGRQCNPVRRNTMSRQTINTPHALQCAEFTFIIRVHVICIFFSNLD